MPVVLQARVDDRSVIYEPLDFAAYASAVSGRGIVPPAVPFRVRVQKTDVNDQRLEPMEREIAAFFGLGSASGIDYVIARQ
jgi:hypothetical protein